MVRPAFEDIAIFFERLPKSDSLTLLPTHLQACAHPVSSDIRSIQIVGTYIYR